MNLHSSCRRAIALQSVCGQMIYVVLVSCLMGSGTYALNVYHIDVIFLVYVSISKLFFWDAPIFLIWCEFYPPLNMALVYCAVVIFFSPEIPNGSEMNRFSLSLIHSTCLLVEV